jgi:hypothetical protein
MSGRGIQARREAAGILLGELAEVAGLPEALVLGIEQGRRVRWDALVAVEQALELLLQWQRDCQASGGCPCVGCAPPVPEPAPAVEAPASGSRLGPVRPGFVPCLRENYRPRHSLVSAWPAWRREGSA